MIESSLIFLQTVAVIFSIIIFN